MRLLRFHSTIAVILAALALAARLAQAQNLPAAVRSVRFSVFGAATGTWTGLSGGKNVGITAGLDLELPVLARFHPAVEVRGTYPVDGGQVDAQRNILGGLRVGYPVGERLKPYAFVLFGLGRIDYAAPGYRVPGTPVYYLITSSNVIAGGAGLDVALTNTFSVKADFQINHQRTPVTATGSLNPDAVNVGLVWRPRFHRRHGVSEIE